MTGSEGTSGGAPSFLLWSVGVIAIVLGAAAFVLWGTRAGDFIFDLVAAYCA
jgi:hypothetical protein